MTNPDDDKNATEMSVAEAREQEAVAHGLVEELIRQVESGEDLSANELIPGAKDEAQAATRLRKGVERQALKRKHQAWAARVEDLKADIVAAREAHDEAVEITEERVPTAATDWVSALQDANAEGESHRQRINRLASEAQQLGEAGFSTRGHLHSAASMVRQPVSPVDSLVRVMSVALESVDMGSLAFRQRQMVELLKAYSANESASLQRLIPRLPGRLGQAS